MDFKFRQALLATCLLATYTYCSSTSQYNITQYTAHLPAGIKAVVTAALTSERDSGGDHLGNSSSSSELPCHSEESSRRRSSEQQQVQCPPSKYRQATGECNNVRHAQWGARGAAFIRVLQPAYADGISTPRRANPPFATSPPPSFDPQLLPSPYVISHTFRVSQSQTKHDSVSALIGAWAELLLHDLASTGNLRSTNTCCPDGEEGIEEEKQLEIHGECYGRLGASTGCQEYMRTLPALEEDRIGKPCRFDHRNQMNLASSFLDASALYGSTDIQLEKLRTYDRGLVNVTACSVCHANALYSAILREHNRICVNLAQLNRHWTDETLFLESRRIVAAEIQHITYNEFLPTVLDDETSADPDLRLQTHGHYSKYSSSHKAGVFNEVAIAALPALLSMIPGSLMNRTAENFAEMVDFLIGTAAQAPSLSIDVPLRNDWDTAALLVHMGRDHGLNSYTTYAKYCRNITRDNALDFNDLLKFGIGKSNIKVLKEIYNNVNDVDLLVGSLLERATPGSLVGPTISCLLKQQFALLRRSDRFFYENDLPPSSLTKEQLREIRKVTIAGLLCANTDDLDKIQPKAFQQEDPYLNARISCEQHPLPQLTPWLEMDHMVDLTEEMLMDAIAKAEQEVLQRRKMEYEVWTRVGGVDPKSPAGTAASFSKANKQALKLANSSLLFEFASNEIINSLMNTRRKRQIFDNNVLSSVFRDELSDGLQNVDISTLVPQNAIDFEPNCEESGPCDPTTPFRTFSGHCNNLRNPAYGKSLTIFNRLLPSQYEDGISRPRTHGVTGVQLPSPRVVSTVIHPDISNLHSRYTLMTMQFAQFLDHDLTMTPIHKGFHESIPNCRQCDSSRTVHPECNPFPIPSGDHYYPEVNVTSGQRMCFPFMRSLPGQRTLGPREQVNQNTAYLDSSQVYGENTCVARDLKGYGGRMNCTVHPVKGIKDLLPRSDHHPECKTSSGLCFIAGDGRASEQPALTVIHTIFMREHNRLVAGLKQVNPHWDDEKMFEHARRILMAQNQHMTYNEFLPRILSWNAVNLYGLKLLPQGYFKDYNPNCNGAILNEFAAAAFRIGHSLLRPHIPRLNPNYQIVDPPILLRDGFFKVDMIMQPGMVDEIARGLVSTPMEALDQFITGEVTNHLFEDRKVPFSGIDLISLNIQRARDHGIPSYNNYRALCNLKRATSFEELAREIPQEVIVRLKRVYATVDDIELFPGGMSERPLQGGLVGPTFACIIAIQFRQLRKCDRFWYENEDPVTRFTEQQLAEIRKATLAKLICDNLDVHSDMQRAAFDLPSNFLNPRVACRSLPALELGAWREGGDGGLLGGSGQCVIGGRQVTLGESAFPSPCTSCVCTQEGGQCASLRVTDCTQLVREWSRDTILRDDVCTAQCGFLLRDDFQPSAAAAAASSITNSRAGTSSSRAGLSTDLVPPPSAGRSRTAQRARFTGGGGGSGGGGDAFGPGFKFPDLTPFVAK